jgi:hypothetical protein
VPAEAKALADAARACGIEGDDLIAVVGATLERQAVPQNLTLTRDEKLFVYGVALWLAQIDGIVTHEETQAAVELGDRFGLSVEERALVWAAARSSTPDAPHRDARALAHAITHRS